MKIIPRSEAMLSGLKRYFTGKKCKHGHLSEKYTSDSKCVQCKLEYDRSKPKIKKKSPPPTKSDTKPSPLELAVKNGDKYYYTGSKCKNGHTSKRVTRTRTCYECAKVTSKAYSSKNKAKTIAASKLWAKENSDRVKDNSRKYYESNYEIFFIRSSLKRIMNNWKGGRARAESLMGYTVNDLKHHLESQFKEGMSWENRSEWHIDHIKPVVAFIRQGVTDPKVINALSNLQPLWAKENLSKGSTHQE